MKYLQEGQWNLEELVVSMKHDTRENIPAKRDRSNRCNHNYSFFNWRYNSIDEGGYYWLSQLKGRQDISIQSIPGQGRMMPMNEVPRQRLGASRLKVLNLGIC